MTTQTYAMKVQTSSQEALKYAKCSSFLETLSVSSAEKQIESQS